MVTANRARLARRAIACFAAQTYADTELVIVDDGDVDYGPLLRDLPPERVIYHRLPRSAGRTLGELRNLSLDLARGDFIAQWDDDDWYHPTRLERQIAAIGAGADACLIAATLMHLDTPAWFDRPYVGRLPAGVPGTIVHRRSDSARYPAERRGEDTVYLDHWRGRIARLPASEAGLFIRCFHGSNTWEAEHFLRRLRNAPDAFIEWNLRRLVGATAGHSRFRLTAAQRSAFETYISDSRRAGVFA